MTSVLATLFVLILLVLMGIAGYRDGAFFTAYALLRNLFAFVCAMTFCEPLALVLAKIISDSYPAQDYYVPIAFAAVAGAVFAIGRWLKVTYTVPGVPCLALADRIAGPALGVMNAVVLTGSVLVLWSLLPFAKYLRHSTKQR